MSKVLKLVGVSSFISAATKGVNLTKGQTALFDDTYAAALLKKTRPDREGQPIEYFTEQDEGTAADFDFTTTPAPEATQASPPEPQAVAPKTPKVVKVTRPSRQRAVSADSPA